MPSHKIVPYYVRLRPVGSASDEDYWDLTDIPGEDSDFSSFNTIIDLFEKELEALETQYCDDNDDERTMASEGWLRGDADRRNDEAESNSAGEEKENTTAPVSTTDGGSQSSQPVEHTIEGVISYGNYGHAANFRDTRNGERTERGREIYLSEELGHNFILHIPSGHHDRAILVLHRIGGKGIKQLLNLRLQERVGNISTDVQLEMTPIAPESVIDDLLSADALKAFEIVRKGTPRSGQEADSSILGEESNLKSTVTIDAGHGKSVPISKQSVRNKLERMVRNQDYPYVEIHGGDPEDFKAKVIDDDKPRKVSMMGKRADMEQKVNLANVEIDPETGHPTPKALGREARELLNDVLESYNDRTISEVSMLSNGTF